jgi:hypothetical protein
MIEKGISRVVLKFKGFRYINAHSVQLFILIQIHPATITGSQLLWVNNVEWRFANRTFRLTSEKSKITPSEPITTPHCPTSEKLFKKHLDVGTAAGFGLTSQK